MFIDREGVLSHRSDKKPSSVSKYSKLEGLLSEGILSVGLLPKRAFCLNTL